MTSTPTYDEGALLGLAKRAEYETWLLEAVYAIAEQELFPDWPDGLVYPLDQKESECINHLRAANLVLGDWRPGFLNAGAPLVFVSSFKLLDMLIEWVLENNGHQVTFHFKEKLRLLNGSVVFPPFLEQHAWLKERLAALYRILEPLRGTIIHDKHFISTEGSLRVSSSRHGIGPPVQISAAQLRELALTMVTTFCYISGAWEFDPRREKTLRHDLDELAPLHGLPLFGQRPPYFTRARVYQTNPDPLLVDPAAIALDLSRWFVDQDCLFDLRILIVRDSIVTDAYLFPWSIFAERGAGWRQGIQPDQYRSAIPADIAPKHLRSKAG